MADGIVDPQVAVISNLEDELKQLEEEMAQAGSEDSEATQEVEATAEAEVAPTADGTEEETDTQVDTTPVTEETTEEPEEKKIKLSEFETVDKRWRDGVKWNTKLRKENIELEATTKKLTKQLEALQAKYKSTPKEILPEIKAAQEEYPDLMDKLLPAMEKMTAKDDNNSLADELAELKELQAKQAKVDDREYVLTQHPDLDLITAENSAFWRWLNEDTSLTAFQKQVTADKGSGKDIAMLMGQFKREFNETKKVRPPAKDNAAVKQKLKDAAEATVEPKTKAGNVFTLPVKQKTALTTQDLDDMDLETFSKLSNAELKQVALAEASMV